MNTPAEDAVVVLKELLGGKRQLEEALNQLHNIELTTAQRLVLCAYGHVAGLARHDVAPMSDALAAKFEASSFVTAFARRIAARRAVPMPASIEEAFDAPSAQLTSVITSAVKAELSRCANRRKILLGLAPAVYELPEDTFALSVLRAIPGLDSVVGKFVDAFSHEMELQVLSTNVRATPGTLPTLYELLEEASLILDVKMPELYVQPGYLNAFTMGAKKHMIVLTAGATSILDRDELLFVLGHELAHIKAGHVVYGEMARWIGRLAQVAGQATLGIAQVISATTIEPALNAWYRQSEFSADRAGLLACQDPRKAISALAKLGGFPVAYMDEFDPLALAEQAAEFESRVDGSIFSRMSVMLESSAESHPRTMLRIRRLIEWVRSGDYDDIISMSEIELRDAASRIIKDPLLSALSTTVISALADWARAHESGGTGSARRRARQLLLQQVRPPDGALSRVYKVDLQINRRSADDLVCTVVLLHALNGTPQSVTLSLPQLAWTSVPPGHREALIRENKRMLTFELFRASA